MASKKDGSKKQVPVREHVREIKPGVKVTVRRSSRTLDATAPKPKAPSRTAAKAANVVAMKPATLSEAPVEQPVEQPVAVQQPAQPVHTDDALIYGMLTVLSFLTAVGAYAVLYSVLEQIYPGWGAAARALVPLAVEMIMGFAAHRLVGAKRTVLALGAMLIILGCAATEIDAARTAPAIAKRERMAAALAHHPVAEEVKPAGTANDNVGRQANLQLAQNAGKALELQAARDQQARDDHQAELDNAKADVDGEGRLPIELAILGAIGSSCFMPLLEAFLRARRQQKA